MGCCIKIEILDSGFEVEIPDVAAIDKAEAAAKKSKGGLGPYTGDMHKSFAAKTVKEVLAIVEPALKSHPQTTYDEAFAEAASEA